ncbi:inositol monophosphatase family protein [Rubrimonas cliftonensis]|uniref:Inositol-phosphate phosphatase / L-galactose 1-phosphate phosphatase / histidinol-phosphatase n=1 Tax=Rubrimonas cliftonensis TaxID=89524 RepID=A0A1H4GET1_9RHOB|nr:inositol monophosphatase family protein [Rubrimonas cliftonensis]SEB08106.1 inositol-phosphate phosphatase / L-galactose 1-phosphate phosphatase / histidinol-phosphatase [Rubrimonas cliftonensis]
MRAKDETPDNRLIELARRLAHAAREVHRAHEAPVGFEIKDDGSPVTALDRAVERRLRREIAAAFPDHGVLGEEEGPERTEAPHVWVIDPIDGTRQFAAGLPNWGTLIALCREGRPVIGVIDQPWCERLWLGVAGTGPASGTTVNGRAVRCAPVAALADCVASLSDPDAYDAATSPGLAAIRARTRWNVYDGGCLGYGALAEGRIGLCLNGPNLEPFDIAALVPVVEGAGGVISGWRGEALTIASSGAILASATPALHAAALETLAGAVTQP